MADPDDNWPQNYDPGSHLQLHALGVIAITYANFQASVDALFLDRAAKENMPAELARRYYFTLSEDKRIEAIKWIFKTCEKDERILDAISNLREYFQWCQKSRNNLLNAERYPPGLGGIKGTLYLVKRASKLSSEFAYIKLTLDELREIADCIRTGVVHCAEIHIYLRYRGQPETIPSEYQDFANSLPQELSVPPDLELAPSP
jgi:hypothetical protein